MSVSMRPQLSPGMRILGFISLAILLLTAMIALARYPSFFRRGREFHAVFRSVAGVNVGDQVRYGGLIVGAVTKLELDPDDPTRINMRFRVRRRTPVRVDTKASITQLGLLGEPFVALVPGSPTAPPLEVGGTLATIENQSFQDAMNRLARFFENTDTLFLAFDDIVKGKPWERLDRTLVQVEQLVGRTAAGSDKVFSQLDQASQQLSRVLERTDRLIAQLDTTIGGARPGLQTVQTDATASLRELRALVADARAALETDGGLERLMHNLHSASENLARLSERVEREPLSVLRRRAPPAKPAGPPIRE